MDGAQSCKPVHKAELLRVLIHEVSKLRRRPAIHHRAEVLLGADEDTKHDHEATRDAP